MYSATAPAPLWLDEKQREAITALLEDERLLLACIGKWRDRQANAPDGLDQLLVQLRPSLLQVFAFSDWDKSVANRLLADLTVLFDRLGAATVQPTNAPAEIDPLSPGFATLVFQLRDALRAVLADLDLGGPAPERRLDLFSDLLITAAALSWRRALAREQDTAERRLAQLQRLEAAGRAINATLDPEQALQTVATLAQQEPEWDAVVIARYISDERHEQIAAAGIDETPAATAWPALLADRRIGESPQVKPSPSDDGTWLVVPFSSEYVQGSALFYSGAVRAIDRPEIEYAVAFADHAARALTSAALYQQLKRDTAARDHFFSMVNHDLKSPLANIKAQVDLLLRRITRGKVVLESDDGRAEVTERLEQISQRVRELGRQIDDLVDVSRIEAERFAVHLRREDLAGIVRSAVESLQILFPDREIRLELPPSPVWTTVDSVRITQVINNLVMNAVKYSDPPSPVEVRLARNNGWVALEVADQGHGIPAEEQRTLFQSYFRGANRRSNERAGLGLGLYIVAGIVRAHQGRISVASQAGVGSTFTVSLPLAEEAP